MDLAALFPTLLVGASLAYAVSSLSSTEPLRAILAATWGPLGKLARCPYCLGFWTTLATLGASDAMVGTIVGFGLIEALAWGLVRGSILAAWPGLQSGALLGALLAGPVLLLWSGHGPVELVSTGLLGALSSLLVATILNALQAYVARTSLDDV